MAVTIDWNTTNIEADVKNAAIAALKDVGELILDESNKLAPIDEGTLIRSGNYDVDAATMSVNVFYDTNYAARQHESLELRHKNGRKAKFLESALRDNKAKIIQYIADKIKRVV